MQRTTRRGVVSVTGMLVLSGCAKAGVRALKGGAKAVDEGPTSDSDTPQATTDDSKFLGAETATETTAPDSQFIPATLVETDTVLESGQYSYWELEYSDYRDTDATHVEFEYEIIVRSGDPIDAMLLSASEFEHFTEGERSKYYTEASTLNTVHAQNSIDLPLDEFVFVVDNTTQGDAEPRGGVELSTSITGTPQN